MAIKLGVLLAAIIGTYYKGQIDAQAKDNEIEKELRAEIVELKEEFTGQAKAVAEEVSTAKMDATLPNVTWRLGQLEDGQGRLLLMVEEVRSTVLDLKARGRK